MSRLPRLLPLVAVAVGGVLALKIVSGLDGAPAFLKQATAFAEDAAPGEKVKKPIKKADVKAADVKKDADKSVPPPPDPLALPQGSITSAPDAASAATPAAGSVPIAPICAPSAAELAKEAGLSPAELRVLQSLQSRRGELDARSQAIDTQMAVLAAAEAKVDAKIKSLGSLKDELTGMIGQADAKSDAEITRLVTVYSNMKPDAAAQVLSQLDDKVRVPVAGKMKERVLAAILNKMAPADAKKLTEKLAARFSTNGMAEKIASPEAQPAAAPTQATAPAKAPVRHRARPRPKAKAPVKSDGGDDSAAAAPPAPKPAAAAPKPAAPAAAAPTGKVN